MRGSGVMQAEQHGPVVGLAEQEKHEMRQEEAGEKNSIKQDASA